MKLGELARRDVPLLHVCGSIDPILGKYSTTDRGHLPAVRRPNLRDDQGRRRPSSAQPARSQRRSPTSSSKASSRPASDRAGISGRPNYQELRSTASRTRTANSPRKERSSPAAGHVSPNATTAMHSSWPASRERSRSSSPRQRGARESPGFSAPISSIAMRWSIWPCWRRVFTSSPGRFRTTPTARVEPHWDAVYKHLTDARLFQEAGHGRRPAAPRATLMPGRSKTRTKSPASTPRIRCSSSAMSKTPPLDDLSPLAKAGVPLLHVCGSLDPGLNDNTRVVREAI